MEPINTQTQAAPVQAGADNLSNAPKADAGAEPDVAIVPCPDYDPNNVTAALVEVLAPFGGLDWVKPGMRIAVKTNLLGPFRPEKAVTTHPVVLSALCKLLTARGAEVVVGDSPGGFFTKAFLTPIYAACGLHDLIGPGVRLNDNFSETDIDNPEGHILKAFRCTNYLLEADAIIDACKLKTHGMMAYTGSIKNMFGAIPGMKKSEMHYQFSQPDAFANMLVDLYERVKPRLTIADAVTVMEGNGPSTGTPRHMGALLVAANGHALDLLGAKLMGLTPSGVPTLAVALERGYIPGDAAQLHVHGDYQPFVAQDFASSPVREIISWGTNNPVVVRVLERALADRPEADKNKCTGCQVCAKHCPISAIEMKNNRPVIQRKECIRCFCCQEFCPTGAMQKVRPWLARKLYK